MTTVIRRAEPLDVVNLYRLISAHGEFNLLDRSDEARALVQVLEAIRDGHTLVATNKAGRIVATIAFIGVRLQSGLLTSKCVWSAVAPAYSTTLVVAELLDLSLRSADKAGIPVHVTLALPPDSPLTQAVIAAGFKAGSQNWIRKNKKKCPAPPSVHRTHRSTSS